MFVNATLSPHWKRDGLKSGGSLVRVEEGVIYWGHGAYFKCRLQFEEERNEVLHVSRDDRNNKFLRWWIDSSI
jgi:hypothetical protein